MSDSVIEMRMREIAREEFAKLAEENSCETPKDLRILGGMTQMELSRASNVLQTTVSHVESGYIVPRDKTIQKLAKALGVPIERYRAAVARHNTTSVKKTA